MRRGRRIQSAIISTAIHLLHSRHAAAACQTRHAPRRRVNDLVADDDDDYNCTSLRLPVAVRRTEKLKTTLTSCCCQQAALLLISYQSVASEN